MQTVKKLSVPLFIVATIIGMLFIPAIPQDVHYHNFSDQRTLLGMPHCINVISNIPYLIIGLAGIYALISKPSLAIIESLRYVYVTFFAGVALVFFGSGYYHLDPSNASLVWDRLAMSVAFMALFTLVIAEYVNETMARKLFLPFIIAGLAAVLYWHWTETQHQGDLRPYLLVQFLPVMLIPLMLLLYRPRFSHQYYYWLIIACYVLAKSLELADGVIFDALAVISGHSLKHLASAAAPLLFYLLITRRHKITMLE